MSVGVTFVGDGGTIVSGSGGGAGEDEGETAPANRRSGKRELSGTGSWFSS